MQLFASESLIFSFHLEFLLEPFSSDPVLDRCRILRLAYGAATAARRELAAGDILRKARVSGGAQVERAGRGRWAHERSCESARIDRENAVGDVWRENREK